MQLLFLQRFRERARDRTDARRTGNDIDTVPEPWGTIATSMSKPGGEELPFPESLCHRCGAPPRYIRTQTSVFILCPLVPEKYPRQPVRECAYFRPKPER